MLQTFYKCCLVVFPNAFIVQDLSLRTMCLLVNSDAHNSKSCPTLYSIPSGKVSRSTSTFIHMPLSLWRWLQELWNRILTIFSEFNVLQKICCQPSLFVFFFFSSNWFNLIILCFVFLCFYFCVTKTIEETQLCCKVRERNRNSP